MVKVIANNCYYCGFNILKIVDNNLLGFLEHSECSRLHHCNTKKSRGSIPLRSPLHESESISLQTDLCTWYVIFDLKKEKPPFCFFFIIYFASGGYCPHTILVKCECIIFCTNVRIWIDLGEKYGTKYGLLLIFRLIIHTLEHSECTRSHHFLSFFFFWGGACPGPSSTRVNPHHNRATYPPGM